MIVASLDLRTREKLRVFPFCCCREYCRATNAVLALNALNSDASLKIKDAEKRIKQNPVKKKVIGKLCYCV